MFAKVYSQIFASSIAENYTTRHVFMDLLVLADSEGVVDMTASAISRTTNVPLDVVKKAIQELSEPDTASRSPEEEGRRIALIDSHRDWGWRIINYEHYRQLRDEEGRRAYHRDYMRKKRREAGVKPRKEVLRSVKSCDAVSTHAEGEGDAEGKENTLGASSKSKPTPGEVIAELKANPAYKDIDVDREFGKMLAWCKANNKPPSRKRLVNWLNRVEVPLVSSTQAPKLKSSADAYKE